MPPCTAFKRNCTPCTSRAKVRGPPGLCGIHANMVTTPALRAIFDHDQEIYRDSWEKIRAGTHELVGNRLRPIATGPVAPVVPPPPPAICGHMMTSGRPCTKLAVANAHNKCNMHHTMMVRRAEDAVLNTARREMRRRHRAGATVAEIDGYAETVLPTLTDRTRRRLLWEADGLATREFFNEIQFLMDAGGTLEQVQTQIGEWMIAGDLSERRAVTVMEWATRVNAHRMWRANNPIMGRGPQPRADQREAQLALDPQNVHTREISDQMRDSLAILLKVSVPDTQTNTTREIRESWYTQGRSPQDVAVVYADMVSWWNRPTIFTNGDKLYKRCMRGLWYTIKGYSGEARAELEKRLWEECRDAAIPYVVCTQGHMARLSNVLVGFDDAFVPPVPVGEILQQKMAAISAMDVESEKQIELAKALLVELKVPEDKHADWLSAF